MTDRNAHEQVKLQIERTISGFITSEIDKIEAVLLLIQTVERFVKDQIPNLGLEFNVWSFSKPGF